MFKRGSLSESVFSVIIYLGALTTVLLVCWVLGDVFVEGSKGLSWHFLVSSPENSGRAGGIAPILVATVLILFTALFGALPLGLALAVWLSEFRRRNDVLSTMIGQALDVLAGVPSIVYGLFGNAFFGIFLGLRYSILSGGLTLACMILPVFIRTCESGLRSVNDDWRRGALALGMRRSVAVWKIILPAARPAILAGLILSVGRATAETAALIFTSGYVDRMPDSLMDSGRSLAVHIYDLSMNVTGGDSAAYSSALVLIILIVLLNVFAQSMLDQWFYRRSQGYGYT